MCSCCCSFWFTLSYSSASLKSGLSFWLSRTLMLFYFLPIYGKDEWLSLYFVCIERLPGYDEGNIAKPNFLTCTPFITEIYSICWLALINSILSIFTYFLNYMIFFVFGLSFFTGLFEIRAAFAAYSRVMWFSSKKWSEGWRQAIMQVVELPPRDWRSRQVSLLSR